LNDCDCRKKTENQQCSTGMVARQAPDFNPWPGPLFRFRKDRQISSQTSVPERLHKSCNPATRYKQPSEDVAEWPQAPSLQSGISVFAAN